MAGRITFGTPDLNTETTLNQREGAIQNDNLVPELAREAAANIRKAQSIGELARATQGAKALNEETVKLYTETYRLALNEVIGELSALPFEINDDEDSQLELMRREAGVPGENEVKIQVQAFGDSERPSYRILLRSGKGNPSLENPSIDKVGLRKDYESNKAANDSEDVYMIAVSGCLERACKALVASGGQVTTSYMDRPRAYGKLDKDGAVHNGVITFLEGSHSPEDYIMFAANGGFAQECPLPLVFLNKEN